MSNITADGAYIRALELKLGEIVQFIKPERSVHAKFVRADLAKFFLFEIELVLNIADQLLQHIFKCNHPDSAAEFIDHDRQVRVLAQEQLQQAFQRHHLGQGNQITLDLQEIRVRIAHHGNQFLDVNEAHRIIEILAAQREPGVAGFDGLFHIGFEIILQVEVNDFTTRRHDVAHDAVAQVEHVKNELATERRHLRRFFAFSQNQTQLFLAVGQLSFGDGFYTENVPKDPIARSVQEPDRWFKDRVKVPQRCANE